jgi:maltose alpha-D-glucosyltransferase / alpha-amylase
MWEVYALEPRMRLNLGIRRRLAPLLQNDPDRIKCANSILLTFIGSPVIYYGDEIGMGDNIWLDDRNGVRTPMQWNDRPNAGFTREDVPADRLYSPIIEGQTYGSETVNVAAQERDPASLLNWTREALRVRRQHPVFGRGNLTLLHPETLAVLAYLRNDVTETVLVVNNLSGDPLQVTLDLDAYNGRIVTDLFTGETLEARTTSTWTLSLAGYAYRWLSLGKAGSG